LFIPTFDSARRWAVLKRTGQSVDVLRDPDPVPVSILHLWIPVRIKVTSIVWSVMLKADRAVEQVLFFIPTSTSNASFCNELAIDWV
jgi:hypothetical protein